MHPCFDGSRAMWKTSCMKIDCHVFVVSQFHDVARLSAVMTVMACSFLISFRYRTPLEARRYRCWTYLCQSGGGTAPKMPFSTVDDPKSMPVMINGVQHTHLFVGTNFGCISGVNISPCVHICIVWLFIFVAALMRCFLDSLTADRVTCNNDGQLKQMRN